MVTRVLPLLGGASIVVCCCIVVTVLHVLKGFRPTADFFIYFYVYLYIFFSPSLSPHLRFFLFCFTRPFFYYYFVLQGTGAASSLPFHLPFATVDSFRLRSFGFVCACECACDSLLSLSGGPLPRLRGLLPRSHRQAHTLHTHTHANERLRNERKTKRKL